MASGTVIKNKCGFIGLGCIVAIKHDVGGSVMIYAHLQPNTNSTAPRNNLQEGAEYPQHTVIGYAGQSGGQAHIHLHIEFRDGSDSCNAPETAIDGNDCGDISWARDPIGWDGKLLVDGYYINGYFDSDNYCGPGVGTAIIVFNYDGSAVHGSIAAPFIQFPYLDNGIQRHVLAFVSPNDFDFLNGYCPSHNNCEINQPSTVFADQGKFSGGGGILYSTNSQSQPNDTTPPTGFWTSPSSGQTISSRSVTLSVTASDNSGGSGIKEVRFSALWSGQWRGVGTASTSPYSVSWDMCTSGVPDGDVELGMEVRDNANNKWVYSEHYTNIHINKSYDCAHSTTDTIPPTGSWTSLGQWTNDFITERYAKRHGKRQFGWQRRTRGALERFVERPMARYRLRQFSALFHKLGLVCPKRPEWRCRTGHGSLGQRQ